MKRLLALSLLLFASCPLPAQEKEIVAMLQQSVADWNRADIPAFMSCYEDSADTTFVSKAVVKGTAAVRERYRTAYPTPEHMGTLTFSELAARVVSADTAIVTGRFRLDRTGKGGGPAQGIFTLVVRKSAAGWRIIHDHTTAL